MSETPIEDYLDELLRRTRSDARTTRRLLDEAGDHLYATTTELVNDGMSRQAAELEAVRRFGPVTPIVQATARRSFLTLVVETLRGALFLAGCGLVAVGISGLVALVMNVWAGHSFVGGVTVFRGQGSGPSVQEVADDAVVLRVIADWLDSCYCSATSRCGGTPGLHIPSTRPDRRTRRSRFRRSHRRPRDRLRRPSCSNWHPRASASHSAARLSHSPRLSTSVPAPRAPCCRRRPVQTASPERTRRIARRARAQTATEPTHAHRPGAYFRAGPRGAMRYALAPGAAPDWPPAGAGSP